MSNEEDFEPIESDEEHEEFSLEQLSEAYASVIEEQTGVRPIIVSRDDEESSEANEINDDFACPISPESIVEAILFVGAPEGEKLTSRSIAGILRDVSAKQVTKIVHGLNEKYAQEDAAYRVQIDGGTFALILDPELGDFQNEYYGRNKEVRLSQAAIDVMAIVAYNQPTTKELVEKIRGKPSGSVLAQLVRRELIVVEQAEEKPRTKYYRTSERFLDLFQLESIADLPQTHDVSDIAELAD